MFKQLLQAGAIGVCQLDACRLGGVHLHEHFVDPVTLRRGRYLPPEAPGYSAEMKRATLEEFRYPDGAVWRSFEAG